MERVFICTTEDRLIAVLEVVEPYVRRIEGPSDGDPGYMLTCDIPSVLWNNITCALRS